MAATINITQLELQKKKEELKTAISARNLLEDRVTSLIDELTKRGKDIIELKIEVLNLISHAQKLLALAQGSDRSKVEYVALSSKERFFISQIDTNLNGIRGTSLKLEGKLSTLKDRKMTLLDTSYKIDSVTKIYEQLISKIIKMTSDEMFLRKIGDELKKTQKRVNALDNILIKDIKK
ncbi:MAG: V-type ATP synthase subunit D, partial [Promethearchaeota archaeon]